MSKNGAFFLSVVQDNELVSSVWDPFVYRRNGDLRALSDYARIARVGDEAALLRRSPFRPIEYRDIPSGNYLTFALEPAGPESLRNLPLAAENELLLGTMRAYLGNAIVTPMADWVDQTTPIFFQVKSEFVILRPDDGLTYFWLAFVRSQHFLHALPLGSGGTRPRLQAGLLAQTPVRVPSLIVREGLDSELRAVAESQWRDYIRAVGSVTSVMRALS